MRKNQIATMTSKIGKNAPVRNHITKSYADTVTWFECPCCKKLVFLGQAEVIGALKKYKKQVEKV